MLYPGLMCTCQKGMEGAGNKCYRAIDRISKPALSWEASEAQLLYLFEGKFKSGLSMAQLYHVKKEAERRMPANDFRHGRQQPVSMLFDRAGLVLQLDL